VLVGLSALTHDEGLVLLLPLAIAGWSRPRRSWRALAGPAVVLAAVVLTVGPWTLRNALVDHAFVPVSANAGRTLAGTFNAASRHPVHGAAVWLPAERVPSLARAIRHTRDEAAADRILLGRATSYMGRHPGYVAEAIGVHTLRMRGIALGVSQPDFPMSQGTLLSRTRIGAYWLWALGLLGLAGLFARRARTVPRWVWLVPTVLFAATVVFSGGVRFRTPLDPFLLLGLALAADSAWSAVRRRRRPAEGR
jgi:hypothetical protein